MRRPFCPEEPHISGSLRGLQWAFHKKWRVGRGSVGGRGDGPQAACCGAQEPRPASGLHQAVLWVLGVNRGGLHAGTKARGHSCCWSRKGFTTVNCPQHWGLAWPSLALHARPQLTGATPVPSIPRRVPCNLASSPCPETSEGSLSDSWLCPVASAGAERAQRRYCRSLQGRPGPRRLETAAACPPEEAEAGAWPGPALRACRAAFHPGCVAVTAGGGLSGPLQEDVPTSGLRGKPALDSFMFFYC